jgi:ribonucleoside-diphosphate reductase beta chain
MIQRDASNARIVHDTVEKYTPIALEAISPVPEQVQQMLANGDDPWLTPRYAQKSLGKKLKVIGLSMKLPPVPPVPVQGM